VGFIKGKSAIHIARNPSRSEEEFYRAKLLARGYYVSTAGKDENAVRKYIKKQEKEDERIEQLNSWNSHLQVFMVFNRFERFKVFQSTGSAGGL